MRALDAPSPPFCLRAGVASLAVFLVAFALAPAARAGEWGGFTNEDEPEESAPKHGGKKSPDTDAPAGDKEESEEEEKGPPPPFTMDAELRLVSAYMWRGLDLSGVAALQPYVELELQNGLQFSAFSSSSLDDAFGLDDTQFGLLYHWVSEDEVWEVLGGYLLYFSPGSPISGEVTLGGTYNSGNLALTLTYARGHLTPDATGNSLNLFAQWSKKLPLEGLTINPFMQFDYLDEYGIPAGLSDGLTAVEGGFEVNYAHDWWRVMVAASVITIPSPYVQALNLAEANNGSSLRPWFAIAFAYVQE